MSPNSTKLLTPHQEADAHSEAHQAFVHEYRSRFPEPQPHLADLVHENKNVVNAQVKTIGCLPLVLLFMAIAAIIISSEKTMLAFYNASPNRSALGGMVGVAVMLSAAIMIEGANIYGEFAIVREMLKKNLPRRKFTLPSFMEGVWVFLGYQPAWKKEGCGNLFAAFYWRAIGSPDLRTGRMAE